MKEKKKNKNILEGKITKLKLQIKFTEKIDYLQNKANQTEFIYSMQLVLKMYKCVRNRNKGVEHIGKWTDNMKQIPDKNSIKNPKKKKMWETWSVSDSDCEVQPFK